MANDTISLTGNAQLAYSLKKAPDPFFLRTQLFVGEQASGWSRFDHFYFVGQQGDWLGKHGHQVIVEDRFQKTLLRSTAYDSVNFLQDDDGEPGGCDQSGESKGECHHFAFPF